MSQRKHLSLKTRLAAALLQMKRMDENGQIVRVIPHQEAKTLTADQIISRFQFDHYPIPHAEGGPDEPWNIDPSPTPEHREKTAKVDVPTIAKSKRVRAKQAAHAAAMEPDAEPPRRRSRWAKDRKIPSRPINMWGSR